MTERCGKPYGIDRRCGLFMGHAGSCGPWRTAEEKRSSHSKWVAEEKARTQKEFPHTCAGDGCAVCRWVDGREARAAKRREENRMR